MSIEKKLKGSAIPPDEKRIDQAIEDTFPASDPSATTGGITKINPSGSPKRRSGKQAKESDQAGQGERAEENKP